MSKIVDFDLFETDTLIQPAYELAVEMAFEVTEITFGIAEMAFEVAEMVFEVPEMAFASTEMVKQHCTSIFLIDNPNISLIFYDNCHNMHVII